VRDHLFDVANEPDIELFEHWICFFDHGIIGQRCVALNCAVQARIEDFGILNREAFYTSV